MNQRKIKREFLAQALRAYLEPCGNEMLTALDAANLSIEFLIGFRLLDASQIEESSPLEDQASA